MTLVFKYIIVKTGAILFNENTTHKDVARGLGKVYGAGFVKIENVLPSMYDIKVYGRSDSLDIDSNEEDEEIILDLFTQVSKIKYFNYSVELHYKQ